MTYAASSGVSAWKAGRPIAGADPVLPDAFREALGQFATGVTVITVLDQNGRLHGLTANAFSALSLAPPLVLACINHEARCLPVIEQAGKLAIHILAAGQDEVARGFARRGGDRSSVCGWTSSETGHAILDDYAIALECRLRNVFPGGDHAILVSEVQRIHRADKRCEPLLYYRGQMFSLSNG